jgi:hypothetical protein
MILRLLVLLIVGCLCHGPVASAADLPFSKIDNAPHRVKPAVKQKKKPAQASLPASAAKQDVKAGEETQQAVIAPKPNEIELSWVLEPLVAHADGSKREGSDSDEANLVVTEPGSVTSSYMTVELYGHVVKTARTEARIDVRIGENRHTVEWGSDSVEAGRFSRIFRATLVAGKLPPYFPVSAIALVSRDNGGGAVLVTLEKITIRLGDVVLAQSQ